MMSPYSLILLPWLLPASFAFNHVERREKRRLVFAKSFSARARAARRVARAALPVLDWAVLIINH